jgi:hypothetical protein
MRSPCCLSNAWTNLYETSCVCVYIYHGTWAHLDDVLHKSLTSVCVSVCVSLLSLLGKGSVKCIRPFIARQRSGKHVPAEKITRNNRNIIGWVCLCIPLSLLGNNSVKTFPRPWRIVGVVFYAVRVVLKESRRLILFRISCCKSNMPKVLSFKIYDIIRFSSANKVTAYWLDYWDSTPIRGME